MNFNETEFRRLIDETHKTITRLGTTKGILMEKVLVGNIGLEAMKRRRNVVKKGHEERKGR